jgi:hypothetical protein
MRRSMLRKLSMILMVMSSEAGSYVSAGARRVARVEMVVEAVAAKTASTVESLATCLVIARSPKSQESLAVVVVAVLAIASIVVSLVTCPGNVISPRNPESLAVAVVVAVTALTVVSLVTCLVTAISLESPVSPRDLAADLAGEIEELNFLNSCDA